jgi:hypothetical protein
MRTKNQFFAALAFVLLLTSTFSFAQDDKRPMYLSVTTMYWNADNDMSMDDWKAGEKEYMDKVTSKNEYIMWGGYFTHLLTPNSNEVVYGQSYPNWEAMEKAAARSAELEKAAWPDKVVREAFLKKMNSAYSDFHRDEIYATIPGVKALNGELPDGAILYIRENKRAYPDSSPEGEFSGFMKRTLENVINKNDYIKGYYPSQHNWGSDRRDFIQAFYLNSLGDLDKMFTKNTELMKAAFTEDEAKAMGKYFKGHGDYIYSVIKL